MLENIILLEIFYKDMKDATFLLEIIWTLTQSGAEKTTVLLLLWNALTQVFEEEEEEEIQVYQ